MLKNGAYSCSSCTPAVSVPADGKFHKVSGHTGYDEQSVQVVDPHTVRYIYRRGGKVVTTSTDTVSNDGRTLVGRWQSDDNAKHEMVSGMVEETRIGPAPAGAHAISGSWRANKVADISDAARTMTIAVNGRQVTMSYPTGESLTAMSGGPFVKVTGDPVGEMDAVQLVNPRTLKMTAKRGGKITNVLTMTVSPDGKTLKGSSYDPMTKATNSWTAHRQ